MVGSESGERTGIDGKIARIINWRMREGERLVALGSRVGVGLLDGIDCV